MSAALLALVFGLGIGIAVGTLGGGGSILAVPVLVYVLGQGVHEATTAALLVVAAGALAGVLGHSRGGWVCWRHALFFAAAALPGTIVGTWLSGGVTGTALIALFAIVMLGAAAAIWRKSRDPGRPGLDASAPGEDGCGCPPLAPWRDGMAGFLVGTLTGFFGVGGGFLIVPTLAIVLAFSIRAAVGTSLAVIGLVSLIGLAVHLLAGRSIDFEVTGIMAVTCMAGGLGGASIAGRVPQRTLGQGFAVLVMVVSIYLLTSVAFLGGPPAN